MISGRAFAVRVAKKPFASLRGDAGARIACIVNTLQIAQLWLLHALNRILSPQFGRRSARFVSQEICGAKSAAVCCETRLRVLNYTSIFARSRECNSTHFPMLQTNFAIIIEIAHFAEASEFEREKDGDETRCTHFQ